MKGRAAVAHPEKAAGRDRAARRSQEDACAGCTRPVDPGGADGPALWVAMRLLVPTARSEWVAGRGQGDDRRPVHVTERHR